MARKRGGLAGIWDRNKKILAPVATGIAGLINPALGAAVGGAIGGFDRPGKGGIGFDVGKGAMGAASGYAMGKSLQGVKGLFAPKLGAVPGVTGAMPKVGITPGGAGSLTRGMTSSSIPSVTGAMPKIGITAGGAGSLTRDMVSSSIPSMTGTMPSAGITPGGAGALTRDIAAPTVGSAAPNLTTTGGAMASKSSFLGDLFSPEGFGKMAQGTLSSIQKERELGVQRGTLELGRQRLGLDQQRFGEEQRLAQLDEERRRRVAQLMALFAPSVLRGAGFGGQAQGGAQGGAMG